VLSDVSVRIEAGTTVAVVGPSGAGKTTLADVLLGLVQPASGRVLVDGELLTAGNAASWRAQVGTVPQEVFLFHDTVRANLQWAAPDVTDDDIWRALEAGSAAGFVGALPAGLDTVVGDRGYLLSGGERQRLALARAFLRRPRVIVLDEATSALDHENEQIVQRAIESVGGDITLVVIAHRLSSIRRADRIVVIDAGRVAEAGTWTELMARPHGRLARMCAEQGSSEWPGMPGPGSAAAIARDPEATSQRS
jgi:ATP-binding cassette subfamily C protein